MADSSSRRARLERLLDAARELPHDHALERRLQETSGLSRQNVELGLQRCLETRPEPEHLEALLTSTPEAEVAHVLLSGNVFVAALRAIALGVASSARVQVRASRREPALAEALQARAPGLFELVTKLEPSAGDHLWGYGSDETLSAVRQTLPRGVRFHAHGAGFGAVVVEPSSFTAESAREVALDTALFDQRGCLSPRVVCVAGTGAEARVVARALADALAALEAQLPSGPRDALSRAEQRRSRDAAAYAFELFDAGSGWVSVSDAVVLPPAERNLHVLSCPDPVVALRPFVAHLTCLGSNFASPSALRQAFPGARHAPLGAMQRPPLDGPVDLRNGTQGELV